MQYCKSGSITLYQCTDK